MINGFQTIVDENGTIYYPPINNNNYNNYFNSPNNTISIPQNNSTTYMIPQNNNTTYSIPSNDNIDYFLSSSKNGALMIPSIQNGFYLNSSSNNDIQNLYFPEPEISPQYPQYPQNYNQTLQNKNNFVTNDNNILYQNANHQNNYSPNYIKPTENWTNQYPNNILNNNKIIAPANNQQNLKKYMIPTSSISSKNLNPKRIIRNIDINVNEQYYPYNNPSNNTIHNPINEKPTNMIYNNKEFISPQQQSNVKQMNHNIIKDQNIGIKNPNVKKIQIPNNIKKDNYTMDPKRAISHNNVKVKMPQQSPPLDINAFKMDDYIKNDINKIQAQNQPNNKNNNEKIIQETQIVENSPITNNENKQEKPENRTDNKPEMKPKTEYKQIKVEDIQEKKPKDNTQAKAEEKTEGVKILEIIPKNTVQSRPLTKEDYDNIFVRGIGLMNLGNTCFINSCLQALIHCKLFMHQFFKKCPELTEENAPISYNFYLICIALLDVDKKPGQKYIDISYFKYIFGKKHPIFNGYNQNDSQEFCRIFLEDLSFELNEIKTKGLYRALTNTGGKTKSLRDREFDMNFKEREKSIIIDLFYSQIITSFICECNYEIYSFQKLLDFPLLLPEKIEKIDITDLFKIYFKTEVVDFENKCEKCNKVAKHKKEMKISRPPEILIISLQRINQTTQKKNECIVTFPDLLNLYDFIDHDMGNDKESYYQLFSIINHIGSINGGHYFTYVKPLGSKNWYEFNDSHVRHIKVNNNIFPYAYALFYIKNKYK